MDNPLKYPLNGTPLAADLSVSPLTYQPQLNQLEPRRARYKLWELQDCWHCMIVGTCLSLSEVRQLGSKAGLPVAGKSDYDIHQLAVESAANNKHPLTIRLQKQLEQKFALTVKQFRAAKDAEALSELWNSGWKAGNVAGSLWALITHPQATRSIIIITVFGQVHPFNSKDTPSFRAGRNWNAVYIVSYC
ncbi:hypothetical protein [Granulosicoccus antarcticus]|uniref:Uncharacterized protein n=1 Tax=Granulosicoccus antarcticus IMCC3135 TaxID=1192854 RepID=A0A2Z2NUG0_9GAMM|nr:hypothetical protein [Granulosicoccus antarcticus]ASJ71297.1 hypothetical protein IMCC3135_05925 [Granulosicoccus antarcticus IMCC3135]